MIRFREFLQQNYHITNEDWQIIQSHFKVMELKKNDPLIEYGKVCRYWGFVLDGILRYFDTTVSGDMPTCYFAFENFCITDPFTFFKQKPSILNLSAVTNCTIAVATFNQFNTLKNELPAFAEIANDMLLNVSGEFANQKVMTSLDASGKYDYFVKHYPTLAQRVPLQHIASYLGIAQPSLSRIRKSVGRR